MEYLFLVHMYTKDGLHVLTASFVFQNQIAAELFSRHCSCACEIQKVPLLSEIDMHNFVRIKNNML